MQVLQVDTNVLTLETEQDLLRQDSSVFLEQRGAGGGQADIVLRGGTFEQTLVLLNGFRINDSQTAHHNLDLPVPLDAMDSIEVLHGAGSTLHGVDALSGVVDFMTAAPPTTTLRLRAGGGSFGSEEESLLGTLARKRWSSRLTADRNFSTGFMADRDYTGNSFTGNCTAQQLFLDCQNDRGYRNEDASSESWASSRLGISDLLFAASDRSFGANQFYGPYNSWERTKGWFASARQELGSHTEAAFGYRRHTDEYVLALAIHSPMKTTTSMDPGRHHCGGPSRLHPHLYFCLDWRETATAFEVTTGQRECFLTLWVSMRAIVTRVMWIWICALRKSVGISRPGCGRRFFRVARGQCFRRIWREVYG